MSGDAPAVRLRAAVEPDLPRLVEIESAAHAHPWTGEQLRRELGNAYATVLVAEPSGGGGEILGFVVYWALHDELEILDVATAPEARRTGIGRALLDAALDDGRRRGARRVILEARPSNVPAISLYRSLGFLRDTVRKRYYSDGEDAVLMSLVLGR